MIRTVDTLTAEALIDYNSPLERQCASNLSDQEPPISQPSESRTSPHGQSFGRPKQRHRPGSELAKRHNGRMRYVGQTW